MVSELQHFNPFSKATGITVTLSFDVELIFFLKFHVVHSILNVRKESCECKNQDENFFIKRNFWHLS